MSLGPLGILGGGQLGRMTLQAAGTLGVDVVIAEREHGSPAARLTDCEIVFSHGWSDASATAILASKAPIITLENEFVDAAVLADLEARGSVVLPSPACVARVQDKLLQKQALAAAKLPLPRFWRIQTPDELQSVGQREGWPLMLKARRDGYDGRGNVLVRGVDEAEVACPRLGWPERTLLAEEVVAFERELAVIVVRDQQGCEVTYPVVETCQDPDVHVCRSVLAPAPVGVDVAVEATRIARTAVEAVGGVGTFGVELFQTEDGRVLINELAPRPHNSGHYSIEACATSQFANHVRAVLGLPLGDIGFRGPAAMVNVLGSEHGGITGKGLGAALAVPDAFVHLYGKCETRPGRKMGHVTALGSNVGEALARAQQAADYLVS